MERWEYCHNSVEAYGVLVQTLGRPDSQWVASRAFEAITLPGQEGWKLVTILTDQKHVTTAYYFKRRLLDPRTDLPSTQPATGPLKWILRRLLC